MRQGGAHAPRTAIDCQEFYAHAGSKEKTLKLYEGYAHDPLNDVGKAAVMDDIKAWIAAHLR